MQIISGKAVIVLPLFSRGGFDNLNLPIASKICFAFLEAMESIAKLAGAVKKGSSIVDNYERQSEEYVEKNVKDRELASKFWGC